MSLTLDSLARTVGRNAWVEGRRNTWGEGTNALLRLQPIELKRHKARNSHDLFNPLQ